MSGAAAPGAASTAVPFVAFTPRSNRTTRRSGHLWSRAAALGAGFLAAAFTAFASRADLTARPDVRPWNGATR